MTLEIRVDERGAVSVVKVLSGPPELAGAATACVGKWRYRPGTRDGVPMAFPHEVTVHYVK